MIKKLSGFIASSALMSSVCFAGNAWTQVDCGGLNETLQVSKPFPAGITQLNYAQFLTLILGDKATYGWPKGRPMTSNLYIDADVKSVTPIQVPNSTAAYLIIFSSKNHYPDTRVVCTFSAGQE